MNIAKGLQKHIYINLENKGIELQTQVKYLVDNLGMAGGTALMEHLIRTKYIQMKREEK